ncbi:MAG: hypothetical protein ABI671_16810 [Burkholderiales bacterium]
MNDSPARDRLETEGLDPDEVLVERRHARDEQNYRDWCESSYGMIAIGQEEIHPADILDKCAPDAARRGRADALVQVRTDLEQEVCDAFPAPIAVPFHAFLEGPRSAQTRLLRLRDTWESTVRLLAALSLSEAAISPTSFSPLAIREGKDQAWRPCKRRDFVSDKLSVRIGLTEGVLHRAGEIRASLQMSTLLPVDVLGEIRRLNVVRNGFSHEAAKSEAQARVIVDEVYPVLRDVLLDLRDLQEIKLIRLHNVQPGGVAEIEELNGHAQSRRIREIELDPGAAAVAMSAAAVDGMHRVLARFSGMTLDLGPFFYAADDDTGHRTRVLSFKSKDADDWHLECVADSTTKKSSAMHHEALLARLEALLGQLGQGT